MVNEPSFYNRVEDQKWRESLNEWRAAQSASEVAQNDRIDDAEAEIESIHEILDGKQSDREDLGIKGDIDKLKDQMRHINGVLWPNDPLSTGAKVGMVADVRRLMKQDEHALKESGYRWDFRKSVVVALIAAAVAVLTNLDRIGPSLKKFWNSTHNEISPKQKKPSEKTSRRARRSAAGSEAVNGDREDVSEGRSEADGPNQ